MIKECDSSCFVNDKSGVSWQINTSDCVAIDAVNVNACLLVVFTVCIMFSYIMIVMLVHLASTQLRWFWQARHLLDLLLLVVPTHLSAAAQH